MASLDLKKVYKQLLNGKQLREVIYYCGKQLGMTSENIIKAVEDAKDSFGYFAQNINNYKTSEELSTEPKIETSAQKLILDYLNKKNQLVNSITIACFILNAPEKATDIINSIYEETTNKYSINNAIVAAGEVKNKVIVIDDTTDINDPSVPYVISSGDVELEDSVSKDYIAQSFKLSNVNLTGGISSTNTKAKTTSNSTRNYVPFKFLAKGEDTEENSNITVKDSTFNFELQPSDSFRGYGIILSSNDDINISNTTITVNTKWDVISLGAYNGGFGDTISFPKNITLDNVVVKGYCYNNVMAIQNLYDEANVTIENCDFSGLSPEGTVIDIACTGDKQTSSTEIYGKNSTIILKNCKFNWDVTTDPEWCGLISFADGTKATLETMDENYFGSYTVKVINCYDGNGNLIKPTGDASTYMGSKDKNQLCFVYNYKLGQIVPYTDDYKKFYPTITFE